MPTRDAKRAMQEEQQAEAATTRPGLPAWGTLMHSVKFVVSHEEAAFGCGALRWESQVGETNRASAVTVGACVVGLRDGFAGNTIHGGRTGRPGHLDFAVFFFVLALRNAGHGDHFFVHADI